MKTRLIIGLPVLLCLSVSGLPGAIAAVTPPAPTVIRTIPNPTQLIATLQEAYTTLSKGDHDYQGHRAAAMKDISDAAKLLGSKELTGDGKGSEPQTLSDLQLRSVQMSLLSVGRGAPAGTTHNGVVEHINGAIHQLTLALEAEANPKAPAPPPGTKPLPVPDSVGTNAVETASLARIYDILRVADHDYKGHRVTAMAAIARASRLLGGNLAGDGRGHEAQTVSDAQLHQAATLLGQVEKSFAASDPKSVLTDLTEAVNQLNIALSIK